jgi:hypothetical protein
MNKLLLALLLVSGSAVAENTVINDILRVYGTPQPVVIYVQPSNMPLPPVYLQPVQGNANFGGDIDFGGARLNEVQPLELGK